MGLLQNLYRGFTTTTTPVGLSPQQTDDQTTLQSQAMVKAIRALGAQNEAQAGTVSDAAIADRGLTGGGYITDRNEFERSRVRTQTGMDVMDAIAQARARVQAQNAADIARADAERYR